MFFLKINCGQHINAVPAVLLTFFGFILSVIGFLIVIATSLGYLHYIADITMIVYRWDKIEFYKHPGKPVRFQEAHRMLFEITTALFLALFLYYIDYEWKWVVPALFIILIFVELLYQFRLKTYFRERCFLIWFMRNIHPIYYEFIAAVFVVILVYVSHIFDFALFNERSILSVTAFIITFLFIESLYQFRIRKYFDDCWLFISSLKNDTEGRYRNNWDKWFRNPKFQDRIRVDAEQKKVRDLVQAFSPDGLTDKRWQNFHSEDMYKMGKVAADLLGSKQIVLGADSRKSSCEMLKAFKKGYEKKGGNVLDCGTTCTTPMIEFLGRLYGLTSVMITASHLDETWQGIKITSEKMAPEGTTGKKADNRKKAFNDYVESFPEKDFGGLSVSVDYFEGSAASTFPEIARRNNIHIVRSLNDKMSGDFAFFPTMSPDPSIPENLCFLIKIMKTNDSQLGVAFDGDGDRHVIIFKDDSMVKALDPVLLTALSAMYYKEPGTFVLGPFVVPAEEAVKSAGHTVVRVKRGRPYMINMIKELNKQGKKVHKGLEGSYHSYGGQEFDDGLRQFLEFCKYWKKGINIQQALKLIGCKYTLEMRVECEHDELFRKKVIPALVELGKNRGLRVNTEDGIWVENSFIARKSSRENVVSFLFYGENPQEEMEKVKEVILESYKELAENLEKTFNTSQKQKEEFYW